MRPDIPLGYPLRAAEGVMACELGDGLALLDHSSGKFFLLDEVGAFIWKLLARPVSADDVAEAVKEAYDADPEKVDRDVREFVQDMVDIHLFEVQAPGR